MVKKVFILVGAFAFIMLCLFIFKTTELNPQLSIDTHIFADYGVLVGGIATALFTILNIILLIQTLNEQRNNFIIQQKNFSSERDLQNIRFEKAQIESRFFELLKMHRENSNEISLNEKRGKKIFLTLLREFKCSLDIVSVAVSIKKKKLKESDVINIAYLCFFFGAIGANSESIIKEKLQKYNEPHLNFVDELIKLFVQQRTHLSSEFDYKLFEGHQIRLGHYYRQLYQIVKYIDKQPTELLSYPEKYQYIKTLRVQLSTQEQILMLFNSLSDLGKAWEMKHVFEPNRQWITKYNLIANIYTGYTYNINVQNYYPNVEYEGIQKNDKRIDLEKSYT